MSEIPAYNCICQNCNKIFKVNSYMTNVVDVDNDAEKTTALLSGTLNNVDCPKCDARFTYEIPMLIFSIKKKYAIKVSPSPDSKNSSSQSPPHFLFDLLFEYRNVSFQIEAVEKIKIFEAKLDDRIIEQIKLQFFEDKDALPFDEVNLIFDYKSDNSYHFIKINSDNQILDKYTITSPDVKSRFMSDAERNKTPEWKNINRYTIKNMLKRRNQICQN